MLKFRRRARLISAPLLLAMLLILVVALGPYLLRVERFHADPAAGYHADFYVYVSPGARPAARAGKALLRFRNDRTSQRD